MRNYLQVLVEPAPHLRRALDTKQIMGGVFFALLPIWGLSIFKYGLVSLFMGLVCMAVCCGLEYWILALKKQSPSRWLNDYSALITGLLLALTLPPSLPFWMAALGAAVSVTLGKHAFGGLGHNPFNPAIVGRVFLQASFTAPMTSWVPPWQKNRFFELLASNLTLPLMRPNLDALSGATPLGQYKFAGVATDWWSLLLDQTPGSLGEVSPLLILLLGLALAWKRYLDWRIPLAMLAGSLIFSGVVEALGWGSNPLVFLCSGGLMLGAWFMATDMVSSPVTPLGVWLYGGLIALLIVVIRTWGGLPEGVAFAILIGNAVTPLLHLVTQPRVYGTPKNKALG